MFQHPPSRFSKTLRFVAFPMAFLFSVTLPSLAFTQTLSCNSPYQGKTLTRTQLETLLAQQKNKPLNLCGTNLSRVDLSNLNLKGSDFSGSDLSYVKINNTDFSKAKLIKTYFRWATGENPQFLEANLTEANFEEAVLTAPDFRQTILQGADFNHATLKAARLQGTQAQNSDFSDAILTHFIGNWGDFSKATFANANLTGSQFTRSTLFQTDFTEANLNGANLSNSTLEEANFTRALVSQTDFSHSNVKKMIYQPHFDTTPHLISLAMADHFSTIQFTPGRYGIPALVNLRTGYKKLGLRAMDRQITAMLKINEMRQAWKRGGWGYFESAFNYVFFYLTSEYGNAPGRALRLLVIFIFLFALPYAVALARPKRQGAIEIQWPPGRYKGWDTLQHHATKSPTHWMSRLLPIHPFPSGASWQLILWQVLKTYRLALYFSLMAAFQIGWRELNVGNWLTHLQVRDYRLKPRGWIRVLAGSQSLISAYLVVLWALTYFGRPFEW